MYDKEFGFLWTMIMVMAFYSLLLSAVGGAFMVSVQPPMINLPGFNPDLGYTYGPVFNDGSQNGQLYYNVSNGIGISEDFAFDITNNQNIAVYVQLNAFGLEYMTIHQSWGFNLRETHFTTLELLNAYDVRQNKILFHLQDFRSPYRVELVPFPNTFIQDDLNSNSQYTMLVSDLTTNYSNVNSGNAQSFILSVLTLSVPNTNFLFQLIMASPLYFGIAYFTYKFIHDWVPTLPNN